MSQPIHFGLTKDDSTDFSTSALTSTCRFGPTKGLTTLYLWLCLYLRSAHLHLALAANRDRIGRFLKEAMAS